KAIRIQYKWTVLTVTTVGVLMAGLDSRIVIVGLPQGAASLHADAEQAIWITQAYVLGSTVPLLLIGRVSDITGRAKLCSGIFGTAWAHFRLREMAKLERGAPIDWGGFVAFTVFILSLLLALTVAAYGVSEAATVAGLLVLSAAGLSAFVFLERRHPHPHLD